MRELDSDILAEITKRLMRSIEPEKVYLFGSYAADTADKYSDIDLLAVIADTQQPAREIARRGRASLRSLMFPVDLIVCTKSQMQKWADVKCTLIYTVIRKGKLIYESQGRTGESGSTWPTMTCV